MTIRYNIKAKCDVCFTESEPDKESIPSAWRACSVQIGTRNLDHGTKEPILRHFDLCSGCAATVSVGQLCDLARNQAKEREVAALNTENLLEDIERAGLR